MWDLYHSGPGVLPALLPVHAAALPALPAHQRMGPAEDFALIPPLKGVEEWSFPAFPAISGGSGGGAKFSTGQSALLGDFRPPQAAAQPVASTTRYAKVKGNPSIWHL